MGLKGNICYFQSGGPTAVINSSLLGLFEEFKRQNDGRRFYVSRFGIQGLLDGELTDISDFDLSKLSNTPGSYPGSLRKKLSEDDPLLDVIIDTLKKYDIRYLFPNGGNDSMDTCRKLSKAMERKNYPCQVIGIPKTVDNDLPFTDHTPGYGSAAKYIANTILSIAIDDASYKKGRINIIEVMGRDSGYLTASAILSSLRGCAPDYIYVPEVPFDLEKEKKKWEKTFDEKKHCLVVVSEGIRDKDGILLAAGAKDAFGNSQMGGVSSLLASYVEKDGYRNRGIELSLPQRCASYILSATDVSEAKEVGRKALEYALDGLSGVMVTIVRNESPKYSVSCSHCTVDEATSKVESLPTKYINDEGDNILHSFMDYVLPLIKGNIDTLADDGLLDVMDPL